MKLFESRILLISGCHSLSVLMLFDLGIFKRVEFFLWLGYSSADENKCHNKYFTEYSTMSNHIIKRFPRMNQFHFLYVIPPVVTRQEKVFLFSFFIGISRQNVGDDGFPQIICFSFLCIGVTSWERYWCIYMLTFCPSLNSPLVFIHLENDQINLAISVYSDFEVDQLLPISSSTICLQI